MSTNKISELELFTKLSEAELEGISGGQREPNTSAFGSGGSRRRRFRRR